MVLVLIMIMIFIIIVAVMLINLIWQIQRTNLEYKLKSEKEKAELEYLAMKNTTKLSYGEKQRLNFVLGKHWKR